jgi:glucose-1-phosphate thymidylyltransferase
MIYYPLATLMMAGINDILIISTPHDTPRFQSLLGDGSRWGITLSYKVQPEPNGIAQAFLLGEEFIGNDPVALILGDNIFYGKMGLDVLTRGFDRGAMIFGYYVNDPERYGVVEFDADGRAVDIEEKPAKPKSHYAVPGLYLYDNRVVGIAKSMAPSARGELEITDVNKIYLAMGELMVEKLGRGIAWLDTGTHQSLLEASHFIGTLEARQGLKIACLEEVALRMGYIDCSKMAEVIKDTPRSSYREYLERVYNETGLCGLKGGVK